ncbi:MAG: hypothetical protein MUO99_05025 [Dehalococcoidales bacterium]|nr:hypothetical protein [Dehalococcoidales bacterium]
MKLDVTVELNLKTKEASATVLKAARLAMKDTVIDTANTTIKCSPVKTGNNRRSIFFGVSDMGHKQASGEGRHEKDTWTGEDDSLLDNSKIQGVIYSTSGYGGFLETGTSKMAAQPYIKPAADRNVQKFPGFMKKYLAGAA